MTGGYNHFNIMNNYCCSALFFVRLEPSQQLKKRHAAYPNHGRLKQPALKGVSETVLYMYIYYIEYMSMNVNG